MTRKTKVGDYWRNIVHKGRNLIIQRISGRREAKAAVIIGNGHSVELDASNHITWADPGMHEFKPQLSGEEIVVYAFYFVRKTATLEDSSKEIAKFIDQLPEEQRIILVGHSKSGICVEDACNYAEHTVDTCIAVSTPHKGTISASGELFAKRLRNPLFAKIYLKTFSDHQVDRDILPASRMGKSFCKPKCHRHINVVSVLSIKETLHPVDLACMFLDWRVGMHGDGIVSGVSQRVIWTDEQVNLYCSHARSLSETIKYLTKNVLT